MDRRELSNMVLEVIKPYEQVIGGSIVCAYLVEFEGYQRNLYNEMYSDTIQKIGAIDTTEILLDSLIDISDLHIYDLDRKKIFDLTQYQQYVF